MMKSSPHLRVEERSGSQDPDAFEAFHPEQIVIPGDDHLSLGFQGALQDSVVGRVVASGHGLAGSHFLPLPPGLVPIPRA
jgi:hypothetical protein